MTRSEEGVVSCGQVILKSCDFGSLCPPAVGAQLVDQIRIRGFASRGKTVWLVLALSSLSFRDALPFHPHLLGPTSARSLHVFLPSSLLIRKNNILGTKSFRRKPTWQFSLAGRDVRS